MCLPKGRLLVGVSEFLKQAGVTFAAASDRCYQLTPNDPTVAEAMIVKARAVPQLVALGEFDLGFCGLDLVRDSEYRDDLLTVLDLGLNPVRIIVAAHVSQADLLTNRPHRPVRIASEYARLTAEWAMDRRLPHVPYMTHGSTEGFAPLHADLILDCVETGDTLRANGLVILEELFRSTTHAVVNRKSVLVDEVRALTVLLAEAVSGASNGGGD